MNKVLASLRIHLVLAALMLSGCVTLSESECRQGNWSDIGLEDGREGHSGTRFSEHVKACAKYGITPDRAAYFRARAEGLREYCTPQHGFDVGEAGQPYENVCPREKPVGLLDILGLTELEFEDAYALGKDINSARAALDSVESEIADIDKRLSAREGSAEEREKARARREALDHERDAKKSELKRLEHRASRYF